MLKKFRWKLLMMMTLFSVLLILLLSLVDMNRMSQKLIEDHETKIELVEMNIVQVLKDVDQAYVIFDNSIAKVMEKNSMELLEQYEKNSNFNEWNFKALKNELGMDVYIINNENTIIHSSFQKDIGINFSQCCKEFSELLDDRRINGGFTHDGVDIQQKTGELKKFSYLPTKDHQYIIELGYDLKNDEIFNKFNFLKTIEELKEKYEFIENIAIYNNDGYLIGESSPEGNRLGVDRRKYLEWLEDDEDTLLFSDTYKGKDVVYKYVKYHSAESRGHSTTRLVEIVYNEDAVQEELSKNKLAFIFQFVGTLILAIILAFLITKMVAKPMYLAFHDGLTGLKNRAAFESEVNEVLMKHKKKFGMLLLDLDNFKVVNDALGHDKGDILLKYVAAYMKQTLPEGTFIARFGGDEFAIVIENISDQEELQKIACFIIDALNRPWINDCDSTSELLSQGNKILHSKNVTVSVGGVLYPNDGTDLEALYKHADDALYYSKSLGKNMYMYYGALEEKERSQQSL